jgi:hypothetical protein
MQGKQMAQLNLQKKKDREIDDKTNLLKHKIAKGLPHFSTVF